jgi:signal transduction histidine kinase
MRSIKKPPITNRCKVKKLGMDKKFMEKIYGAMEVLTKTMAHDIRNPLCSISLNVDKLEAIKVDPLGPIAAAIKDIKVAVERSSSIINIKRVAMLAKDFTPS